jgi:multiple sugar transport system permease protein
MIALRKVAVYAALTLWSIICIVPLYWVAIASLKPEDAIIHGPRFLPFVDFQPSWEAWRFILLDTHENLLSAMFNTLITSLVATAVTMLSTLLFIYAITRHPAQRSNWLLPASYATRILPPVTVAVPLYMMASLIHLLDSRTFLTATYAAINLPVAIWLLRPSFGTRPTDQEESATLDGASHWRKLFEILLPTMTGTIAATSLLIFILCWNEYLLAAFLTTDKATTLTPWMAGQLSMKEAQVGGEAEEWAHMSAAATLMALPLLIATGAIARVLSRRIAK